MKLSTMQRAILAYLRTVESASLQQIFENTKGHSTRFYIEPRHLSPMITPLVSRKLIVRIKRGHYKIAQPPLPQLTILAEPSPDAPDAPPAMAEALEKLKGQGLSVTKKAGAYIIKKADNG